MSTTPPGNNTNYAEMPFKNSDDFREILNVIRRTLLAHADAIHFVGRRVLIKLTRYERRLAAVAREQAKREGQKNYQVWAIRANFTRAKIVAYTIIGIAKLVRSAAKGADKAWRRFIAKYGDDVMGSGEKVFDHTPRARTNQNGQAARAANPNPQTRTPAA